MLYVNSQFSILCHVFITENVWKTDNYILDYFLRYIVDLIWSQTSMVAQWRRTHLPMQETRVQSAVQKDSTCLRATNLKPLGHNTGLAWESLCTATRQVTTKRSLHTAMKHNLPTGRESPCTATKIQHSHKN